MGPDRKLSFLLFLLTLFTIIGCADDTEKQEIVPEPEPVSELEPISEPVPTVPQTRTVYTGTFSGGSASGSVRLVEDGDAATLSLEDVSARLTPDLRLYLIGEETIDIHTFEEKPEGDLSFDVTGVDISKIEAVEIYCVYCEAAFGKAYLEKNQE